MIPLFPIQPHIPIPKLSDSLLILVSENNYLFPYDKIESILNLTLSSPHPLHTLGQPSVQPAPRNANSSTREAMQNIKRTEPCFITKRVSYTLERMYWISTAPDNSSLKAIIVSRPLSSGNTISRIRIGGLLHFAWYRQFPVRFEWADQPSCS